MVNGFNEKKTADKDIKNNLNREIRFRLFLAERKGFEPLLPERVNGISSHAHSTALPSLRAYLLNQIRAFLSSISGLFSKKFFYSIRFCSFVERAYSVGVRFVASLKHLQK